MEAEGCSFCLLYLCVVLFVYRRKLSDIGGVMQEFEV